MCGIWSYIELIKNNINYIDLFKDFMEIKNRGPDMSSFQIINNIVIGFHRLAIMEPTFKGNQPYIIEDNNRTIVFICNGEIYNFKYLIDNFNLEINNNADCMTIPLLYLKNNFNNFANLLKTEVKGEYAFILFDFDKSQNLKNVIAARDHIGIRPLYWNNYNSQNKYISFCSEIKGLNSINDNIIEFEPGTIINININDKILNTIDFKHNYITDTVSFDEDYYLNNVRNSVINSVKRRLISERPIACLLSGGVDSSLVAAITAKYLGTKINTFCCGMNEGTDLFYARKVAEHINSNHTQVFFTPEEGLQAIHDVIKTTETWDTTTIRASVGQYLVCKYIGTNTDFKVVLVGEGPDEVCSSYLFNYNAPNGNELHETAKEYVKKIHMFDGRRADRCISRWGLEGRIALLDTEFISSYWEIPSEWRHPKYKGIEKWWLRKAFENTGLLPDEVLWRKKEAFSDGVSSKEKSWFEIIQDYIKTQVTEEEFNNQNECPTMESYYYKKIFKNYFGEKRVNILPHYWQPKWTNQSGYVDPSARTLNVYNN